MLRNNKETSTSIHTSNVFRGMITLVIGTGSARVVGLISIPIIARIYSPEDYGVLAIYITFVGILAPILSLRYVQAIPLPKSDRMAFDLFIVSFKLIAISSVLIGVLLFLAGQTIFSWFNMEVLISWWWLVILGAAGTAVYELFSLWATRKKRYKTIAKTQFTQAIIGNIAKIALGLMSIKPAGLIIGQFFNQSGGILAYVNDTRKDIRLLLPKARRKKQKFLILYYQSFFWFRLPSQILMVLSVHAPVLVSAMLFDHATTGQLSFTIMALSIPVSLIGMSISRAYYAEIATLGKHKAKDIKTLTIDIQKKLFIVALPISMGCFLFAEQVFVIAFGEEWRVAGRYASILSPFLLLRFTSSPLDQVFNVLSSQLIYLVLNAARVAAFILLFVFAASRNIEAEFFVITLSGFLTTYYLIVTLLVLYIINSSCKNTP